MPENKYGTLIATGEKTPVVITNCLMGCKTGRLGDVSCSVGGVQTTLTSPATPEDQAVFCMARRQCILNTDNPGLVTVLP